MTVTIQERRLTPEEYIEFLKRTDLGSQYPRERFEERIPRLLEKTSLSLAAVDETGKIVGVLMGLTDFAYWLFVTDLGVDRGCVRQGIGAQLMRKAHALAGGEKDIGVYLVGMEKSRDVMEYNHVEWTGFTVE